MDKTTSSDGLAFVRIGDVTTGKWGSAAFTLALKRGDPLLWLSGGLSWLLGGVFFPTDMLPGGLRQAALVLPITHALEALRATLLGDATLKDVGGRWRSWPCSRSSVCRWR